MVKPYIIHKPTHKWFAAPGELAIAIGQMRGNSLCINRFDNCGNVIEKEIAHAATYDLTGYGEGVPLNDTRKIQAMRGAWRYQFGHHIQPQPVFCEVVV